MSGACSKMLELFTGSDRYGAFERHRAGRWTETGTDVAHMQARNGRLAEGLPEDAGYHITDPRLWGNGTLDPGEACDGGPYCSSTCRVRLGSMCCERSDAGDMCSGLIVATGLSAEFVGIQTVGGTRFQWGGAPPAGGELCPSGFGPPFLIAGPCGPPATFPPTSFCCRPGLVGVCLETVASDVAELSSWLATQCNFGGAYPAAVGRCVQSSEPNLTVCTPGT